MRVRETGDRLVVVVEDDGKGGADPFGGSGLLGLGDRVAALDGELYVDSPPGGGTRIRAELPLRVAISRMCFDPTPAPPDPARSPVRRSRTTT